LLFHASFFEFLAPFTLRHLPVLTPISSLQSVFSYSLQRNKRLRKHGLWRMIAPFQTLALRDYVENSGTAGIFRVKPVGPPLTDSERDAIVREAEVLMTL